MEQYKGLPSLDCAVIIVVVFLFTLWTYARIFWEN